MMGGIYRQGDQNGAALIVAIFGGTTEYVALQLKNVGHKNGSFSRSAVG